MRRSSKVLHKAHCYITTILSRLVGDGLVTIQAGLRSIVFEDPGFFKSGNMIELLSKLALKLRGLLSRLLGRDCFCCE